MSDVFGRPEWFTKYGLARAVQTAMGVLAGLFLAAAGILWGYISDQYALPIRLGVSAAAIVGGGGFALGLLKLFSYLRRPDVRH